MRKTFLLLSLSLIFLSGHGQSALGIYAGLSPYHYMRLKSKDDDQDILNSQYTINRPAFQVGISLGETHDNILFHFCYAPQQQFSNNNGSEDLNADRWAVQVLYGGSLIQNTRVQPCLYGGYGLSRYKEPISKLYLNIGAAVRLLVFFTKRMAFFAEGTYMHSFNTKYYVESSIEAETGLIIYF